jgi:hypothetical protein
MEWLDHRKVNLMTVRQKRYSKEELARRGKELYESSIQQQIEAGNESKIVAIDIETGVFEVAKDSLTASDQLLEQYPNAQIWFVRIGHKAVHRIGFVSSNVL